MVIYIFDVDLGFVDALCYLAPFRALAREPGLLPRHSRLVL